MSNTAQTARLPHVLFLGMQGRFSYPSLRALLGAGIQVCAVVIPAEQSFGANLPVIQKREQQQTSRMMLPVLHSSVHTSILELAWERDIPVWEVRQLSDPETIRVFAAYHPDMICVACFSKRIPRGILDIPPLGCLNIVAQEVIEIPDGISYTELEAQCAELGGKLLARSVWDLYNGVAKPVEQDETKSSYHAFPSDDDFVVPVAEWDARHVYNFICGVVSWGTPIILLVGNKSVRVKKAISYSYMDIDHNDNEAYGQLGEGFWIRCKQGSVLIVDR